STSPSRSWYLEPSFAVRSRRSRRVSLRTPCPGGEGFFADSSFGGAEGVSVCARMVVANANVKTAAIARFMVFPADANLSRQQRNHGDSSGRAPRRRSLAS